MRSSFLASTLAAVPRGRAARAERDAVRRSARRCASGCPLASCPQTTAAACTSTGSWPSTSAPSIIEGWLHDATSVARLTAVSPEGSRGELLERTVPASRARTWRSSSRSRRDRWPSELGFICFFELDAPSLSATAGCSRSRTARGSAARAATSAGASRTRRGQGRDPARSRTSRELPDDELMAEHIVPGAQPDPGAASAPTSSVDVRDPVRHPPESPDGLDRRPALPPDRAPRGAARAVRRRSRLRSRRT